MIIVIVESLTWAAAARLSASLDSTACLDLKIAQSWHQCLAGFGASCSCVWECLSATKRQRRLCSWCTIIWLRVTSRLLVWKRDYQLILPLTCLLRHWLQSYGISSIPPLMGIFDGGSILLSRFSSTGVLIVVASANLHHISSKFSVVDIFTGLPWAAVGCSVTIPRFCCKLGLRGHHQWCLSLPQLLFWWGVPDTGFWFHRSVSIRLLASVVAEYSRRAFYGGSANGPLASVMVPAMVGCLTSYVGATSFTTAVSIVCGRCLRDYCAEGHCKHHLHKINFFFFSSFSSTVVQT